MKIENLRSETAGSHPRVVATVTWEDSDRPGLDVFFETSEEFASSLSCDPHAFVAACIPPALRHGERRIVIDHDICPQFHDGIQTAMRLLQDWAGRSAEPLRIEARSTTRAPATTSTPRAGAFLSGGVDSLANLRLNRSMYPADHPRSITDCLHVQGFDIGVDDATAFEFTMSSLAEVARDDGATLIPVRTNLRRLDPNTQFWIREYYGAALASVAHAFSNRLGSASIASTYDASHLPRLWGSHPLLDPCFGSATTRIYHDGIRHTRLDKMRVLAEWDAGLDGLRVCTRADHGELNCGRCEKCLRTQIELVVIGRLDRCRAFEANDVPKSALRSVTFKTEYRMLAYRETIEPLMAIGRADLARSIERKVRTYRAWEERRGWRRAVGWLDRGGSDGIGRKVRDLDERRDWGTAALRIAGLGRRDQRSQHR